MPLILIFTKTYGMWHAFRDPFLYFSKHASCNVAKNWEKVQWTLWVWPSESIKACIIKINNLLGMWKFNSIFSCCRKWRGYRRSRTSVVQTMYSCTRSIIHVSNTTLYFDTCHNAWQHWYHLRFSLNYLYKSQALILWFEKERKWKKKKREKEKKWRVEYVCIVKHPMPHIINLCGTLNTEHRIPHKCFPCTRKIFSICQFVNAKCTHSDDSFSSSFLFVLYVLLPSKGKHFCWHFIQICIGTTRKLVCK